MPSGLLPSDLERPALRGDPLHGNRRGGARECWLAMKLNTTLRQEGDWFASSLILRGKKLLAMNP